MIITISVQSLIAFGLIVLMFGALIVLYIYESIEEWLEKQKNKK